MSRQNHETINVSDMLVRNNFRLQSAITTLAGTYTLVANMSPMQVLDPGGGARDVILPAVKKGLCFFMKNAADAAEVITVKNAAAATIATVASTESAVLFCDGVSWHGLVGGDT
jgi:hypothetical protein